MSDDEAPTVDDASSTTAGRFEVHYTRTLDGRNHAGFDAALTMEDARQLADMRKTLGYHTWISRRPLDK